MDRVRAVTTTLDPRVRGDEFRRDTMDRVRAGATTLDPRVRGDEFRRDTMGLCPRRGDDAGSPRSRG